MATLYGAIAGSNPTSDLYFIDPETGSTTSVGPIGFAVTGMAVDPTSGIMYGVTSKNSGTHPRSIITIDLGTGAGTFVVAYNPIANDSASAATGDIVFDLSGQMWGTSTFNGGLIQIDKVTGAAVNISGGDSEWGGGIAYSADTDTLYAVSGRNNLATWDKITGASTFIGSLEAPLDSNTPTAASMDNDGNIWVLGNAFPSTELCEILIADLGGDPVPVLDIGTVGDNFDALVWTGAGGGGTATFTFSAPTSASVTPSSSVTFTVSTTAFNGDTESITLSASGFPAGVTASFSPPTITAGGSSLATITASSGAAAGVYSVSLTATGTAVTRIRTLSLTVAGVSLPSNATVIPAKCAAYTYLSNAYSQEPPTAGATLDPGWTYAGDNAISFTGTVPDGATLAQLECQPLDSFKSFNVTSGSSATWTFPDFTAFANPDIVVVDGMTLRVRIAFYNNGDLIPDAGKIATINYHVAGLSALNDEPFRQQDQYVQHVLWRKITNTSSDRRYLHFLVKNLGVTSATDIYYKHGIFYELDGELRSPGNDFWRCADGESARLWNDSAFEGDTLSHGVTDDFGTVGVIVEAGQTVYYYIGIDPTLYYTSGHPRYPGPGNLQTSVYLVSATFKDGLSTYLTPPEDYTIPYEPHAPYPFVGDKWDSTAVLPATGRDSYIWDYVFHDGAHWVADLYQNQVLVHGGVADPATANSGDTNLAYYPPTDPDICTLRVQRITDAARDAYPVSTEILLQYNSSDANIVDLAHGLFGDAYWETDITWLGWTLNTVKDARLASDGENLWLAVLAQEMRPYPWATSDALPGDPPPPNNYSITTYRRGSFLGGAGSHGPYTDAGWKNTSWWWPYQLVMFRFNGTEFVRIDEVNAKFNQTGWSGGISHLSVAASAAEPGVCHVLWSESGGWGSAWSGSNPNRGSRTNYSRWSSTAKTLDVDALYYDNIHDESPENTSGAIDNNESDPSLVSGYYIDQFAQIKRDGWSFPLDISTNWMFRPNHALKNEHGFPVAFISKPGLYTTVGGAGTTYDPTYPRTEVDKPVPNLEMWDMRTVTQNAPNILQTFDVALVPQNDVDAVGLLGPVNRMQGLQFYGFTGTGATGDQYPYLGTRNFYVSSLYDDPTLGNPVYLLSIPFVYISINAGGWPDNYNNAFQQNQHECGMLYRVRADGSSGFAYFENNRSLARFSSTSGATQSIRAQCGDFFADATTPWMMTPNQSGISFIDRKCSKDWTSATVFFDTTVLRQAGAAQGAIGSSAYRTTPYYDSVNDKFFLPAIQNKTISGFSHSFSGVGQAKIMRDFLICSLGDCTILVPVPPVGTEEPALFTVEVAGKK